MPFLLLQDGENVGRIVEEMRRIAKLLEALARRGSGTQAHPDLKQIGNRFAAIGDTLQKGVEKGTLTGTQLNSIARNYKAIGSALEHAQQKRATR